VGHSRKRFLGDLTGKPVEDRVFGTAAVTALLAAQGVHMVRVHDVAAMMDVVRVADALAWDI
jgi:dihydropteroate synthase